MKNQLKKEVRAVLMASLKIASEKIDGFSIGIKKNKILVDFSGPGKVPDHSGIVLMANRD